MRFAVIAFVLSLFLLPCTRAAAPQQELRIGVCDTGEYQGNGKAYNTFFLDKLRFDTDIRFTLEPGSYEQCMQRLMSGAIDVMLGAAKDDAQAPYLTYSPVSYSKSYTLLCARLEIGMFRPGDLNALRGAEVGMLSAEKVQQRQLQAFSDAHCLGMTIRTYARRDMLLDDFRRGVIGLTCMSGVRLGEYEVLISNLGPVPYYIARSARSGDIFSRFDIIARTILKRYAFEFSQLQADLTNIKLVSAPDVTQEEYDYVAALPPVAADHYTLYAPLYEYIRKLSGLRFIPQENAAEEPASAVAPIQLDISPLPENFNVFSMREYSDVVFHARHVMLTKDSRTVTQYIQRTVVSGIGELDTIAMPPEMADTVPYYRQQLPCFEVKFFKDYNACFDAVSRGECDAVVIPDFLFGTKYTPDDNPLIRNGHIVLFDVPYHFRVLGDDSGTLISVLDKLIKQIPPSFFDVYTRDLVSKFVVRKKLSFISVLPYLLLVTAAAAAAGWLLYRWRKSHFYRIWAFTDEITGLQNVRWFELEAERILKRNTNQNYAVIDSDMRGFKYINRVYGSAYGDSSLKFYANCLRRYVPENSLLAKGYADHFYLMFPIESLDDCSTKCMDLFMACNADAAKHGFHYVIKDGIAVTGRDFGNDTILDLIAKAGYAKHTIKQDMVNSIAMFDQKMERQLTFEQNIESSIERAFENEEFFVVYQPKIGLSTGRVVGAEALVRWNSPEYGILPPDLFMPVFEKDGYIIRLDFYVYRKVFEFIQKMQDRGVLLVPISVNMSRFHLNAPDFIKNFTDLFSMYRISPSFIEIEVIERASGHNDALLMDVTRQLQAAGFKVAMDDFGTAESSLNMLHTIPVDTLKLDKDFLYRAEDSEDSKIIITKVMEMAKALGKKTICEGVETRQQVEFLKQIGCDGVQGFYYSEALSEIDFKNYLESHR